MPEQLRHSGTRVSVHGLDQVRRAVAALERAGRDATVPFTVIGERMRRIVLDHFEERKQFDGSPWPPLSEATVARRRMSAEGDRAPRPLRDTDVMYTSINFRATSKFAAVGTNDPKAPFHQFGSDDNRRPPRREFIFLREDDVDPLISILTRATIKEPLGMP